MFGFFSFVTGVILAIAILFLAGTVSARYFMTRLTELPPKPVFSEEHQAAPPPADAVTEAGEPSADSATPVSEPPAEVDVAESELEAGAYEARVIQPIGLVLRQGPSQETTRIGGVDYDDRLIILGESADGEWLNVRLPGSGVEGWVKAGNTEAIAPPETAAE